MKKTKLRIFGVGALAMAGAIGGFGAQAAHAEDGNFALGVKGGTLGAGVEVTIAIPIEGLNARAQVNGLTLDQDVEEDGVNYTGELKLFTIGVIVDYYPGDSGFRISAGAYSNGNKFSLTGEGVGGTIEIGDTTYTAAEAGIVSAEVEFGSLSPYIGIGYGNALSEGNNLRFNIDLGVIYQGDPEARISASGPAVLRSDLVVAERELNNELEGLSWYPVLAIGFSYRF